MTRKEKWKEYFNTTSVFIKHDTATNKWSCYRISIQLLFSLNCFTFKNNLCHPFHFNTTSVFIKLLYFYTSKLISTISIQLLFSLNQQDRRFTLEDQNFNTTSVFIKPPSQSPIPILAIISIQLLFSLNKGYVGELNQLKIFQYNFCFH